MRHPRTTSKGRSESKGGREGSKIKGRGGKRSNKGRRVVTVSDSGSGDGGDKWKCYY